MKTPWQKNLLAAALLCGGLTLFTSQAYSQGGVPLWTKRYKPNVNGFGQANAVATDSSGNVIVTGQWDSAGGNHWDYATVKYSAAGGFLWAQHFNGPANLNDVAVAIAVDSSDNVIVTGYSLNSPTEDDYITIKYSSAGVPLWTARYNGPANGADEATAIAVDSAGNIYVTGTSDGGLSGYDYATIKYSPAGAVMWTSRYDTPGQGNDYSRAVGVDNSGRVFVTGTTSVGDYATVAYSGLGIPLWTNLHGPGYGINDTARVAVDSSGKVFVSGSILNSSTYPFFEDYSTVAYSGVGAPLWTNRYDGPGHAATDNDDRARAIVLSTGRVFVTGNSHGTNGFFEYATVAYSSDGTQRWVNRYSGDPAAFGHNDVVAMAADANGTVFVTGVNNNFDGAATLAYSRSGAPAWTNTSTALTPYAIATDTSGNVFVAGSADNGGYGIIKYSSTPVILPRLTLQLVNGNLVISWTDPDCGLQSSVNPTGPFADVPGATSPYTPPLAGPQLFFRLACD